jgi:hypothetical protein
MHWIDTFADEKGYDREELLEVEGPTGTTNIMPLGVVIDAIKTTSKAEQDIIRVNIAQLDFVNPAAPKDYLRHLAGALAL